MKKTNWILLLITLLFSCPVLAKLNLYKNSPCKNIIISSPEKIKFSSNEKVFICGKSEISEWKKIPTYQQEIHLKAMLQARGYHLTSFTSKKRNLYVQTGAKVLIKKIAYPRAKLGRWAYRYHGPIGEPLTPDILKEIEGFIKAGLAENGDPCSEVEIIAFAKEGLVEVSIKQSENLKLTKVNEDLDDRLYPALFRRFYAFQLNNKYNSRLMDLTTKRIINSGVAQYNQFLPRCTLNDGIHVNQKILLGKPVLLSIGVGGSTEDGPLAQLTWKNSRIGKNGSQAKLSLYTSLRQQRLQLLGNWFPYEEHERTYFEPSLTFRRLAEKQLKSLEANASFLYAKSYDNESSRYEFKIGPSYNFYDSIEAAINTTQYYPSLRFSLSMTSHDFEYNLDNPIEGSRLAISTEFVNDSFASDFNAYQFKISGHYLKNLGDYTPAHLVLGLRFGLSTTLGTTKNQDSQDLPLKFRYFIGGAQDLRGFNRNEIPLGGEGAFSTFYSSIELRNFSLITPKWQPLIFLDIGLLGDSSTSLQTPIFWSPGLGMRWDSPVGVFRSTLAHCYLWKNDKQLPNSLSHFQFFFSYGKEF